MIIQEKDTIVYSDLVEEELNEEFSKEEVQNIVSVVPKENIINVSSSTEQLKEAINLAKKLKTPVKDTLHVILARDSKAIMVTRDKHFYELAEQADIKKPEDLI